MDFNPFDKRISELNKLAPDQGNVLVSEPFMQDDYFERSVVLLLENNEHGAIGLILNDDLGININEVIPEELSFDAPLYLGGPVQTENLFFIHQCAELKGTIKIKNELYWGGDFEMLKEFILLGKIKVSEVRFFLGYSGWEPQQLKDELTSESWLIGPIEKDAIFKLDTENLWKETLANMGKEQAILATFPPDPTLN